MGWHSLENWVAASAKNSKFRMARGMSTSVATERGFPLSTDSARASSGRARRRPSATLRRRRLRTGAGVEDQAGAARRAASTASATSAASESGRVPRRAPVAGSQLGRVAPERAGTSRPSMTLSTASMTGRPLLSCADSEPRAGRQVTHTMRIDELARHLDDARRHGREVERLTLQAPDLDSGPGLPGDGRRHRAAHRTRRAGGGPEDGADLRGQAKADGPRCARSTAC